MNIYNTSTILAAAIIGVVAGVYGEHQRLTGIHAGELARLERKHAAELEAYTASLMVAAQATDEAVQLWNKRIKQSEEKTNDIRNKLSKLERRPCLSADAVRLLNSANSVPTATERAAGTTASTPTDTAGYASSQAMSAWAADVIQRYEECRAQIEALRTWADKAYQ